MEIPVVAPQDGTVASIDVAVGDAIEAGAVLCNIKLEKVFTWSIQINRRRLKMEYITTTLNNLVHQTASFNLIWENYLMIVGACEFQYLAIAKGFEPLLLTPIAFGMLLVNIYPDIMLSIEDSANGTGGLLYYFYLLDEWAILPSLIFMGVGAMTDFGPLIANPKSFLLGAAAQFGIFAAYFGAICTGLQRQGSCSHFHHRWC